MKLKLSVLAATILAAMAIPAAAHHSFDAEFDRSKRVELKGTVTKVEWMNPHVWVYLDVKDAAGKNENWQCEFGAPNMLKRAGWTSKSTKEGDSVTISGSRAKDGSTTCNATSVVLANGSTVLGGSSGGNGNAKAK